MIAKERLRQIEVEGWTAAHDDREHRSGELVAAAVLYATLWPIKMWEGGTEKWVEDPWPWDTEWDKRDEHDRVRRLVIAGALIAAEIDRLQRQAPERSTGRE